MSKISFETDLDKCIDVLAQARADIAICEGDCNTCSGCPTYFYYTDEFYKLPSVDRLRVEQLARLKEQAMFMQIKYLKANSMKSMLCKSIVYTLLIALCVALACVLFSCRSFSGKPQDILNGVKDNYYIDVIDCYILPNIKNAPVRDVDADGLVNCVDYSITWKLLWDKFNYGMEYKCEIVRNTNPITGMNHLFIRLRAPDGEWLYIEPQKNIYMERAWGDKYMPVFNFYNETYKWLRTVKVDFN